LYYFYEQQKRIHYLIEKRLKNTQKMCHGLLSFLKYQQFFFYFFMTGQDTASVF